MRARIIASLAGGLVVLLAVVTVAQETASVAPTKPSVNKEAVATQLAKVPAVGSKIGANVNYCATCHTESALWEGQNQRLFISPEVLQHDIHLQKGVACSDCHGGNYES